MTSDAPQPAGFTEDKAAEAPSGVDEAEQRIEYACPRCGTQVGRESRTCPGCGEPLAEAFYALYRPEPSRAMHIIALAALIAFVAAPAVALLWWLWSS